MKLESLPNGHYRVRQHAGGKRYSVNFDHKPTQKEIVQALAQKMGEYSPNTAEKGSVLEWSLKYLIECEKRDLSPSTIRGYYGIVRNTPEWFKVTYINSINEVKAQRLITEYSENHSPKSVRLLWSFYHSVFAFYDPHINLIVNLPPTQKKSVYEPSTADIERIIEHSIGTRYHIPLQLAVLGLRRGEVCALTLADLSADNVLTINKAIATDKDNNLVVKASPKTEASNRRILLPESLADEIRTQGYIFQGNPHTINEYLHKAQDALNIPRFKLHLLRAFAAAYLHQQGFTDSQILAWGGWEESSDVMKRVYRYNLDPEKSQTDIAGKFGSLF